jgi:hypothetical protein
VQNGYPYYQEEGEVVNRKLKAVVVAVMAVVLLAVTAVSGHASTLRPADNTGGFTQFQIISWDGGCMAIPVANVGTRLTEVTCGTSHDLWWSYNSGASAGQLSPAGHPGLSVGDAGGLLELRTAPSTAITYDDIMLGYIRPCFAASGGGCVNGTYWHANQIGNFPTLISNGNSNADYWRFAPINPNH